jgi:hypothetical protein
MKKTIAVILIAYLVTSCKLIKPQTIYITKDSLVTKTETIIKDSIIKLPGDTIRFTIPIHDTVFIVKSARSSSTVQVHKGKISVTNACDEKDLIISKLRSEVLKYETSSSDSVQTITKMVKHVPVIYKVFSYGFWILAALLTALIISNQNLWVVIVTSAAGLIKSISKKKTKTDGKDGI